MSGITAAVIVAGCVLLVVLAAVGAFLERREKRSQVPDHGAIAQYREWQQQATGWWDYYELEDMIDEELRKGR